MAKLNIDFELNKKIFFQYWQLLWFRSILIAIIIIFLLILTLWLKPATKTEPTSKTTRPTQRVAVKPKRQPVIDAIEIFPISNPRRTAAMLKQLRSSKSLRPLSRAESGQSIKNTPYGTYFYIFSYQLAKCDFFSDTTFIEEFMKLKQNRSRSKPYSEFEVHYAAANEIYLVGFISPASAFKLARSKKSVEKKIDFIPYLWTSLNNLVAIPLKRIKNMHIRTIVVNEGGVEEIDVLELIVK